MIFSPHVEHVHVQSCIIMCTLGGARNSCPCKKKFHVDKTCLLKNDYMFMCKYIHMTLSSS